MYIMAHPVLYNERLSSVAIVDSVNEVASLLSAFAWQWTRGWCLVGCWQWEIRATSDSRHSCICKNCDTKEVGAEVHFLLKCPKFGQQ